ncbi:MAG: HAMP domain-containing histidine kinase [Lachnospiraceae bacterium]|nr:HAMP domain-containing histidine kinase [Lachnospiraceae bacterium]
MKQSIRFQMFSFFLSAMILSFAVIAAVNGLFLEKFYHYQKVKTLKAAFLELNKLFSEEDDETYERLLQVSAQNTIEILIENEGLETILFSTNRETRDLSLRLFGYYTGFYRETIDVIESSGLYTLQETSDRMMNSDYLEIWGQFDNGYCFLMRTPLEAIHNAVRISNLFYLFAGLGVTLLALIFISVFSKKLSGPIVQLTELSQQMAGLDFEARYTGKAGNEIDRLGENFNRMSEELEHAIADLKNANNELKRDIDEKERIDEMRVEFLNNVSHELKTPIALIQGYAEGLKDDICDDKESRDFYVDVIVDEAGKMNKMVRQLLSLNQLEFGKNQVQMERFDLTALIRGVVNGMKLVIEEKGAELSVSARPSVYVWGDEFKIEEVITNFLSNALNHLGGARRIDIRVTEEDGIVKTSVFNTGEPIPEESLPRIWDKFYKVDKARTREYGGSGIGLSIVKAIMEGHHQTCGVQNYDNGVAFFFTLDSRGH